MPGFEKLRAEKAALEEQLRVTRDERSKLQRDINAIQQQAESSWATERMENALLRERINDIAAEVAKLAMQLEGPNSAIEAILAADPATGRSQHRARPMTRPQALPPPTAAAAPWPSASARCRPMPPAPASRAREHRRVALPVWLDTAPPALRKSRALATLFDPTGSCRPLIWPANS